MNDRAFASATELTNEIRDRRIGCVELLDFYLARAERHNPTLNAIIVWQIDQARERARAADDALARFKTSRLAPLFRDGALGPLHPPPPDFCLYNIGLYELGIDPRDVLPPMKPA